jgi:hypothetical protein
VERIYTFFSTGWRRTADEDRRLAFDADLNHLIQEFVTAGNLLDDKC